MGLAGVPAAMDLLDDGWRHLRFALRSLVHRPHFTLAAVLALGLGISVSSLTFTVVNAYLFRPLPIRDGADLLALAARKPTSRSLRNLSYPNLVDVRDGLRSFDRLFAYSPFTSTAQVDGRPSRVNGQTVTGNYFQALGVGPRLGRTLGPTDDRPEAVPVVVLNHAFWADRLASDPAVVGRTIDLDGAPFVVVGVAAERFPGIDSLLPADVWVPIAHAGDAGGYGVDSRDGNSFRVRGVLRPGATRAQAQAELDAMSVRLRDEYPVANAGLRVLAIPETRTRPLMDAGEVAPVAAILLLGLGIIALVNTCGNVSGLMLARSVERQKEWSLRMALGASARQVVGATVLEGVLVAAAGGLVASYVVWQVAELVSTVIPAASGYRFDVHPDGRVVIFMFAAAVVAGVGIGLIPAGATIRTDLLTALRGAHGSTSGRRQTRLRTRIVATQFGLVTVVLVTAGLFVSSAREARDTDLGFDVDGRVLLPVSTADRRYDPASGRQRVNDLLADIAAVPGVES